MRLTDLTELLSLPPRSCHSVAASIQRAQRRWADGAEDCSGWSDHRFDLWPVGTGSPVRHLSRRSKASTRQLQPVGTNGDDQRHQLWQMPRRVTFNGTIASVITDTAAQIKVDVPAGADTGYIKVKTAGGKARSPYPFSVLDSTATTTTPATSSILIGSANSDGAVVSGNATYGSPTGTVTFWECGPTASPEPCTSLTKLVGSPVGVTAGGNDTSSASSVSFTPSSTGYWCFAGYYSGDSNYAASSDTATDGCFYVTPGTVPSATTTTPASSSILTAGANSDGAVVSGNVTYGSPTGTVTFYECGPIASPEPCTSQANKVGSPVVVDCGQPMTLRVPLRCHSPRAQPAIGASPATTPATPTMQRARTRPPTGASMFCHLATR